MADPSSEQLPRQLPDETVPEHAIVQTERKWFMVMAGTVGVMLAITLVSGLADALQPASSLEIVAPETLHLGGEFVESNLGTTIEPDGSATVRIIAQQYGFVPHCVELPANTPVRFRLVSADTVHGFLLPDTNVNTMVVPGFVAEVHTRFAANGDYPMPCHEFCGIGHHAMWARVSVVSKIQFASMLPTERKRCVSL